MKNVIDFFLFHEDEAATLQTIKSVQASPLIHHIYVFHQGDQPSFLLPEHCSFQQADHMTSSRTLRLVDSLSERDYICLYLKTTPLALGYKVLERMVQFLDIPNADMAYSDFNEIKGGTLQKHPVIDYQAGSLRDDFDFGSLLAFKRTAFEKALTPSSDHPYAGLYALRLRLNSLIHIHEYLYTEMEMDMRKSGEKQFDYVDPRNRGVQIDMEQAVTEYLQEINALLPPSTRKVDFAKVNFDYEASVIIPVRNRVRTIEDAVRSALQQETKFNFNVIVVDNHSTDGTTEILDRFHDDARLVHIIPERDDLGIGGCWDLAINDARCGRFAVQLDSDDLYSSPATLQTVVDKFYEEQCGMVIGSYRMTDFQLNTLPPGVIDHKEWTSENGHNNALRINGLGAPRAFFTPLLRSIGMPNVSYGEDYAVGLAISRTYHIGRIYEPIYLCRRWEGNSDSSLSIEKLNANNTYKDSIRTRELEIRRAIAGEEWKHRNLQDFISRQLQRWELARKNHEVLKDVLKRSIPMGGYDITVQFNPARIVSTGAKLDNKSIQERPCFLCEKNRPEQQERFEPHPEMFDILLNPYPILPGHLTIPYRSHVKQETQHLIDDVNELFKLLPSSYAIFYNGAKCGASIPNHFHYQAAPIHETPLVGWYEDGIFNKEFICRNKDLTLFSVKGYFCPFFCVEGELSGESSFVQSILKALPAHEDESETRFNLIIWRAGSKTKIIIIPRDKHRPDCYFAEGDQQRLISPGVVDMAGIIVTVRKEDFERITADDIKNIFAECSIDHVEDIIDQKLKQL
ncbi:MAG: DUF4922 domain-containing protein [Phocaeicola sp.]|nr:DUF4922 domain-containing protein [Phocaeicola sp.]